MANVPLFPKITEADFNICKTWQISCWFHSILVALYRTGFKYIYIFSSNIKLRIITKRWWCWWTRCTSYGSRPRNKFDWKSYGSHGFEWWWWWRYILWNWIGLRTISEKCRNKTSRFRSMKEVNISFITCPYLSQSNFFTHPLLYLIL